MENENETDTKILSNTDYEQSKVEQNVLDIFESYDFSTKKSDEYEGEIKYDKIKHFNFAKRQIYKLPPENRFLENGMPWFAFWILNITELSKTNKNEINLETKLQMIEFLKELQHPEGGFYGGPKSCSHLVSTYAAVFAIVNLGLKEGYDIIDRKKMKQYLLKMKNSNFDLNRPNILKDKNGKFLYLKGSENKATKSSSTYPGAFSNHIDGESDLRGTYCCMVIADILNILDEELTKGVAEHIINCQTYEGGFSPEPYCEAHGGYSYCAIASLIVLKRLNEIDIKAFIRWLVNRQMKNEGGFNGRANKLVDSCYSFWQGSIFNMLLLWDKKYSDDMELLYDQLSLQAYILFCCQQRIKGGLIDKPGKSTDLYHTNYASLGLILSQECLMDKVNVSLYYNENNEFPKINPIYGILEGNAVKAKKYYEDLPKIE